MNDRDMMIASMSAMIEIVSQGEWKAADNGTQRQARMYVDGIRDGRIADVTFKAAIVAKMIATLDSHASGFS